MKFSKRNGLRHKFGFGTDAIRTVFAGLLLVPLAACVGPTASKKDEKTPHYINNETKFSSKDFGVEGSPRVTTAMRPDKGTGRYQVGKPYQIKGKWYHPKEDPNLEEVGLASWYGPNFHGRLTANGEIYDQFALTGAHPTMPLPSYAKVTNLENGRSLTVRINDRGPYAHGRVVDLSAQAAKMLDYEHQGVTRVKVEYVGKARMDGLDEQYLMASYQGPDINGTVATGTMIALADTGPVNTGPLTGDINRPAAAINEGFSQAPESVVTLSAYPVPTSRPTLFEGIPFDEVPQTVGGEIVYRQTLRPMAFADDALPVFDPEADHDRPYLGEMPDREIVIRLGRFASVNETGLLAKLFEQAGKLEFDRASGIAELHTSEKYTNPALQFAFEIGLTQAAIR